jgi:predicted RNA binding protein YcfA (HicA-like mRNA interferase family)
VGYGVLAAIGFVLVGLDVNSRRQVKQTVKLLPEKPLRLRENLQVPVRIPWNPRVAEDTFPPRLTWDEVVEEIHKELEICPESELRDRFAGELDQLSEEGIRERRPRRRLQKAEHLFSQIHLAMERGEFVVPAGDSISVVQIPEAESVHSEEGVGVGNAQNMKRRRIPASVIGSNLKYGELRNALSHDGWVRDHTTGSHHFWKRDGRSLMVVASADSSIMKPYTLVASLKRAGFTEEETRSLLRS